MSYLKPRNCRKCQKEFIPIIIDGKMLTKQKYCSVDCAVTTPKFKESDYMCRCCGAKKEWFRHLFHSPYCSTECYYKWEKSSSFTLVCGWCEKEFAIPNSRKPLRKYCSRPCFSKSLEK